MLGDLEVEVSVRLSFMRLSHDISTVVPLSSRITYEGDVCSYDVIDSCYKVSVDGDAKVFSIGDTGMVIFWMVPQVGALLW